MRARMDLADLFQNNGKPDAALEHARKAIDLGERTGAPTADRLRARKIQAEALVFTEPENAETQLRAILDELPASGLARTRLHGEALSAFSGALLHANRDRHQVLQLLEEELRLWRDIHGENSSPYIGRAACRERWGQYV